MGTVIFWVIFIGTMAAVAVAREKLRNRAAEDRRRRLGDDA
jgi:hypothetical protein